MKFSTIDNGTRDGMLVLVNNDLTRMIRCHGTHGTLREAIEEWDSFLSNVAHLDPDGVASEPFVTEHALAPLPRAWQWLDASAFGCHGELLQKAYDLPPVPSSPPLMYQGMSHQFLAGHHRSRFPSEEHGIDFEAELGVIIGDVPLGCDPDDAMGQIKLIVLINDWSLRTLGAAEMRTGFGWVRAKPACSMAPIAVTPDELGSAWKNGRIHLPVMVDYNGVRFGAACGSAMDYGFHELVAHAAATRELCAGTVIGSGTVSNRNYREIGSSCIAERRAIEALENGQSITEFMRFGDIVSMEVFHNSISVFGKINQKVLKY